MTEVKRYTASIMHPGVREDPEGLLVAYHHYAELKAKLEHLTKAGDAVCESPYLWETDPAVIEWRSAKEGKQP